VKRKHLARPIPLIIREIKNRTLGGLRLPGAATKIDLSVLGSQADTDISDHLNFLYLLLQLSKPRELLELGTRGGESTRVLIKYCEENQIHGRSVDLLPAPGWITGVKNWNHYIGDDIAIGEQIQIEQCWPDGSEFRSLDLIFLDTSHEYSHTVKELTLYVPLLSERGIVVLHDTNLTDRVTRTLTGRANVGWHNDRGVTRAIEDYFGLRIEEETHFISRTESLDWFLYHVPWNNGLTVIMKQRLRP
jgi:predicted O-methyltransferase YrrM